MNKAKEIIPKEIACSGVKTFNFSAIHKGENGRVFRNILRLSGVINT